MSFLDSSYIDAKYMHTCLHAEDIHCIINKEIYKY